MDWRNLPPLSALRAFAALAEARSATGAGAALNVSHAAISQQVRALEAHLGLRLVRRDGRRLALTPEGLQLAEAATAGFASIARAVEDLTGAEAARPLQVTTTPTFAAGWLMPRIASFRAEHPDIDLMLNPSAELVELEPGGIDLAIRFGRGDWPGVESDLLLRTHLVVVAARALIGERQISDPAELLEFPWVQEYGTNETTTWLLEHGVRSGRVRSLTQVPGHLVLEGLRSGQGVVATTRMFVEEDIASGRVRVLFEDEHESTGYWIVTRPGVLRPAARAFVRWLRGHPDTLSQPLSARPPQ